MARRPRRRCGLRRRAAGFLFPKLFRLYNLSMMGGVQRPNKADVEFKHRDDVSDAEGTPSPTPSPSPHPKQIPFVPPRLENDRLVIEELGIGFVHSEKARMGSRVCVHCVYKASDDDKNPQTVKYEFVLGKSNQMKGLHGSMCGMRLGDKRKLSIPPLLRHNGKPICEVTLKKLYR